MKYFFKFLLILSISLLVNCSGKKEKEVDIKGLDLEAEMIEAYNEGLKALEEGDVLFAAKNFNAVENLYPHVIVDAVHRIVVSVQNGILHLEYQQS